MFFVTYLQINLILSNNTVIKVLLISHSKVYYIHSASLFPYEDFPDNNFIGSQLYGF